MSYQPLGIADLNALELPLVEFAIEGIVPAGALVLLHAREKTGKSLMLIDMLVSIASGESFLDREATPGPVAYISLEDNLRDVRARVNARLDGLCGIPFYVLPADGSLPDVRFDLEQPDSLESLIGMIDERELAAIGIDNLRESHRQAENDSDAMAPLLRNLRQVAHETNCAIVMTHHERKNGSSEARGSTAITASVDQILGWRLTTPEGGDELAGALTIKGRYGPRQTIHARFEDGARWTVGTVAYVATGTRERIAAWLENAGGWHTAKAIHEGMGDPSVSLKTIKNQLTDLLRTETILSRGGSRPTEPFEYAVAGMSRLVPDPLETGDLVASRRPDPRVLGRRDASRSVRDASRSAPGRDEGPGADRWTA